MAITFKIIVVTFVDDIIVLHNNVLMFHSFVKHLQQQFKITLEGDLEWYLGARYTKSGDSLTATQ
eukprot:3404854-Rhodomonas_salina.1